MVSFSIVKRFIRSIIKNPLKSGVAAFLVWQLLKKTFKEDYKEQVSGSKARKLSRDMFGKELHQLSDKEAELVSIEMEEKFRCTESVNKLYKEVCK